MTTSVHRIVGVCIRKDFDLRFATIVQHMGQFFPERIPKLEQVHEGRSSLTSMNQDKGECGVTCSWPRQHLVLCPL